MEKPPEVLEHVCRLQNWSDFGPIPTLGWGMQYADGARIKTSGKGSFDSATLPTVALAGQLLDEAHTDDVKETLCKGFFMANWQDKDGYECIEELSKNVGAPVATITLNDVLDRSEITLIDPDEDTIYAEPFVNYAKNPATGEFDKKIKVTNAGATAYSTSFVEGLTGAQAQRIWNVCHSLSLKTKAVNTPPSDLTDLDWANGASDDVAAADYLERWVNWQSNREIELPLHMNTVISWGECERFNVVLPQQTNNVAKQCIVERLTIDPNPPYKSRVKSILL
jgi:hypothetical protein